MRYPFYVAVGSVFQKRSLKQNKYYWKYIITEFAKATGQTRKKAEEELLKECALIEKYRDEEGELVYIVERVSDMTTMRAEDYMSDCRDYAHDEYNVYLLAPRESISETLDLHGNTKRIIEKKESEYRP